MNYIESFRRHFDISILKAFSSLWCIYKSFVYWYFSSVIFCIFQTIIYKGVICGQIYNTWTSLSKNAFRGWTKWTFDNTKMLQYGNQVWIKWASEDHHTADENIKVKKDLFLIYKEVIFCVRLVHFSGKLAPFYSFQDDRQVQYRWPAMHYGIVLWWTTAFLLTWHRLIAPCTRLTAWGHAWKPILFKTVNWSISSFLSYEDTMNRAYGHLNNISLFHTCISL